MTVNMCTEYVKNSIHLFLQMLTNLKTHSGLCFLVSIHILNLVAKVHSTSITKVNHNPQLTPNPGLQTPGLLTPIAPAQPPASAPNAKPPAAKLGATWADTSGAINIDVDNLLAPRSPKAGPAPTINQLKSTPNSPAKPPMTGTLNMTPMNPLGNPMSPMMGGFPYMQNNMMNNNFVAPSVNNNRQFANNSFLQ